MVESVEEGSILVILPSVDHAVDHAPKYRYN